MYSTLKRCPELLAWDKLGRRIALDVALGLNYLHSRCASSALGVSALFCLVSASCGCLIRKGVVLVERLVHAGGVAGCLTGRYLAMRGM